MKVIYAGLFALALSCSSTVEVSKVNSCKVANDPVGKYGTLKVDCPDLSFTLLYDNSPDGKDGVVFGIRGVDAERKVMESLSPYSKETGDNETLTGWAYREVWQVGNHQLRAFEFFVNGGTACYEEEEGTVIELVRGDRTIKLLSFFQEETDCGGA